MIPSYTPRRGSKSLGPAGSALWQVFKNEYMLSRASASGSDTMDLEVLPVRVNSFLENPGRTLLALFPASETITSTCLLLVVDAFASS